MRHACTRNHGTQRCIVAVNIACRALAATCRPKAPLVLSLCSGALGLTLLAASLTIGQLPQ
eukprot:5642263-Alexandrium_andersonii.AAC.1